MNYVMRLMVYVILQEIWGTLEGVVAIDKKRYAPSGIFLRGLCREDCLAEPRRLTHDDCARVLLKMNF